MSIGYHLVQSLEKGGHLYEILAMIALDDFGYIPDPSDSLNIPCGGLDLLITLNWSRYL